MISCYFTELLPSVAIMVVLWKSYKEMKNMKAMRGSIFSEDTDFDQQFKQGETSDEEFLKQNLLITRTGSAFHETGTYKQTSWDFSNSVLKSTSREDPGERSGSESFLTYY
mmetsp:Transcript_34595/g.34230  ORF Transcript_34595/g.34230 Transcript_34595/m.34230 type:complete len:111 (-) Transcript_34595:47-379(-)